MGRIRCARPTFWTGDGIFGHIRCARPTFWTGDSILGRFRCARPTFRTGDGTGWGLLSPQETDHILRCEACDTRDLIYPGRKPEFDLPDKLRLFFRSQLGERSVIE